MTTLTGDKPPPALLQFLLRPPKKDQLQSHFEAGETLLWQGAPVARFKSPAGTLFLSLFGLPFFIAGIFMAWFTAIDLITTATRVSLSDTAGNLGLFVVGLVFIGIGLLLLGGAWAYAFWGHHYTRYALTNRRAYIWRWLLVNKLEVYRIKSHDTITLTKGRSDTVTFQTIYERDSDGDMMRREIGFEHLEDGQAVYQLIRKIQSEAQ